MRGIVRRWVLACAAAETVGMAAAAGAAQLSHRAVGEPSTGEGVVIALGFAVAGGLVEGLCLGLAQSWALSRTHRTHSRRRYVLVTQAVAALGWAGASLPGALSGGSSGDQPPVALVAAGGAGLGLAMGTIMGVAQALALLRVVGHPWRWVGANALAWTPAMSVIFVGATTPDATWSWWRVVGLGCVTGCAAGAMLGAVLGRWANRLDAG